MKRILAVVLTAVMLLSVICAAPVSISAEEEGYTVYYVDSGDFEEVYAYAWDGESDGYDKDIAIENSVKMSKTDLGDEYGLFVYEYKFNTEYNYIVFHDGSEFAPSDCGTDFRTGQYFYYSYDTWYETIDEIVDGGSEELSPGYYVVNDSEEITSDALIEDRYLNEETEGKCTLRAEFEAGEALRVVYYDGEKITEYYPPMEEGAYVISEESAGLCDVCFRIYETEDGQAYELTITKHIHDYKGCICTGCGAVEEGKIAGVVGYSLSLEDQIIVNFHIRIAEDYEEDYEGTKVVFTVPDAGANYSSYTEEVSLGYADFDCDTESYKFSCGVPAKELTSEIEAKVVSADGKESDVFTYTVKDYAEYILANCDVYPNEQNIVKALLNYGTAAQIYFNNNKDNLANDTEYMTDEEKKISYVDLSAYKPVIEDEGNEVQLYGASLVLKTKIYLKFYFIVNSEHNNPAIQINDITATLTENGDLYEIVVNELCAHELGEFFNLAANGLKIKYCALSYAYLVQKDNSDAALVDVANALGAYYNAVVEYKELLNSETEEEN